MSNEVHSGPTDPAQALGTLPLDQWHRSQGRADGAVRGLRDAGPV